MAKNRTQKKPEKEMSFLDHLEDLRWHLIRSIFAVLIAAVVAFLMKDFIFDTILFGPKNGDFVTYRALCNFSKRFSLPESFCFDEIPFQIQSRKMAGQFNTHIWTAITVGFIIAFPYILHELWRFISPALHSNEKKASRGFILIASLLFFIGILFGYFVVAPLSINFLGNYQISGQVHNDFDIRSYLALIRTSTLASGVVFELPILVYMFTKLGLITPDTLREYRKFSVIGILVISAVITPPDIASQVIVSIPILILYEISIFISKVVLKREKKKENA